MGLATSAYRKVAPARIEQREISRHSVVIKRATVRGHGRQPVDAELVDLSIYGCRLSVDGLFNAQDRLWLRFAGEKPIAATTIWSEGDQLGCRFDTPLDRPLFRALTLVLA
jgi:PilZ domain